MKALRKNLLATAVVAGLGLSTVAFAGPWGGHGSMMGGGGYGPMGGRGDCPMMGGGRHGGGPGQRQAMMQQYRAERMELLEARLKLKPDQQAVWQNYLGTQNAHHAVMFKTKQDRRDQDETALAHFEERVDALEQNLASMKNMVKASSDLYAALDSNQQQVMDQFFTDRPMGRGQGRGRGPMAGPGQPANAPATPTDNTQ